MGIVLGPDGAVWVADNKNDRVLCFNAATGAFLSVFQQFGVSTGARDLIFPPDGMLYVSFRDASKVSRYNYVTGDFIDDLATSAQNLYLTGGMTWGADGLLYIANVGSLPYPLLDGNITVINPVTKAWVANIPANAPKRVIFQCGICFSTTCALTASGESLETCNNNSTGSNPADDYITFSLNPTGSNLGATYSVTADNGATVTLASGGAATGIAYGTATSFRLRNGTSNGTLYTITITDVNGAPCTVTTTVQQSSCTSCTPPVLSTQNAVLCSGGSIQLTSLVTGNTLLGTLTFHTTLADANAGVNALVNTNVSPAATTIYFVRSENTPTCYSTASMTITVVTTPVLAVSNGSLCSGGSINLATLVASTGGGTLSYYTTLNDAVNGTNPLVSPIVSPSAATSYFIRSQNSADCFDVKKVVVTLLPQFVERLTHRDQTNRSVRVKNK